MGRLAVPSVITDFAEDVKVASNMHVMVDLITKRAVNWDLKPIYQRGEVWPKPYKQNLIVSLLHNVPINTIHLVLKDKDNPIDAWVLDGKQRVAAIMGFVRNDFDVPLNINGKLERVTWNKMNSIPRYAGLLTRFQNAQVSVLTWNPMDMSKQRTMFNRVNYSKPLSNAEKIYCDSYLVKTYLLGLFDQRMGVLKSLLNKQITDNSRYTGIKMLHHILILNYGPLLNDKFECRPLALAKMVEAAKSLDKDLGDHCIDANSRIEDYYRIPRLDKVRRELNLAIDWFSDFVPKDKWTRPEFNMLIDFIVLLIKKYREKQINATFMSERRTKLYDFACGWIEYKNTHPELKRRTTDPAVVKQRTTEIEKMFDECVLGK